MNLVERPFLSFLIENGAISKESLEKIVPSNGSGGSLSMEGLLVTSGVMTEKELMSSVEQFYGVPMATPSDFPQEPLLINNLSIQFMKESKFIPARLIDNELTVIMSNPLDFYTIDAIRLATGSRDPVLYGKEDGILLAIEQCYGSGLYLHGEDHRGYGEHPEYQGEDEENVDHLRDMASEGLSSDWSISSSPGRLRRGRAISTLSPSKTSSGFGIELMGCSTMSNPRPNGFRQPSSPVSRSWRN